MSFLWIDASGAAAAQAMDAIITHVDTILGYPKAIEIIGNRRGRDGVDLIPTIIAQHHADRFGGHPTDATRWRIPVGVVAAVHVASFIQTCRDAVSAGTATAIQTRVAALPNPATIDPSWRVADPPGTVPG